MKKSICALFVLAILVLGCSKGVRGSGEQALSEESSGEAASLPSIKLYTFDCGDIEVSDLDAFSSSGDYAGKA